MNKRQALTKLLRKLNRHYGKRIHIRWRPFGGLTATAYLRKGIIKFCGDERILDPEVLAHEYAHFLTKRESLFTTPSYKRNHPKAFFKHYREVCHVLGIPPLVSSAEACLRYHCERFETIRQHVIEDGKKRRLSKFAQSAVNYLEQHPECDEVVQFSHNISELEKARLKTNILDNEYPDSPSVYHQLPEGYEYNYTGRWRIIIGVGRTGIRDLHRWSRWEEKVAKKNTLQPTMFDLKLYLKWCEYERAGESKRARRNSRKESAAAGTV